MNTKVIGVIVALLLLLGVGGAYFLSQNKPTTQTTDTPATTTTEKKSSSLLDLLSLGKNQRCTFKTASEGSSTEGTVYIAEGKMRGDFKTTVDGKAQDMSMIRDGDTSYIWGSSLPTGIKMTISLDELSSNQQTGQVVNPSDKLDYSCIPWNTDASLFTPPSNIKFSELPSSILPTTGTKTGTQGSSSYCDQITDAAAKAACQKALSGQ
jgi:hypothetical protein